MRHRRTPFHPSIFPPFHHSITPPFHYSIIPLFHHSTIPLFQISVYSFTPFSNNTDAMPRSYEEKPLQIKCPNCSQTVEADFNETTRRYVCPICASPVDAQVIIEKKKRGIK